MFDYTNYKLISQDENEDLFNIQASILKMDSISEIDRVIKLALLMIQNPIEDYDTSIRMLYEFSIMDPDLRILIIGAELNSYWPIYSPNPFLTKLQKNLTTYPDEVKSIIKYLEAINLDNSSSSQNKSEIRRLLEESIRLCKKYVYNYYRLALVSDKKQAKQLMEICLSNAVNGINNTNDYKIENNLSYEKYLNQFITGIQINESQYNFLLDYFSSL